MKLMIQTFLILCIGLAAHGQNFTSVKLSDQFEQALQIDEKIKFILFVPDKDSYEYLKAAFTELGVSDLQAKSVMVVSDISKMPSFVSRMFAIPSMQELKFKIHLDQEGDITKAWPRKEKQITLFKIEAMQTKEVSYLTDAKAIKAFWQSLK